MSVREKQARPPTHSPTYPSTHPLDVPSSPWSNGRASGPMYSSNKASLYMNEWVGGSDG